MAEPAESPQYDRMATLALPWTAAPPADVTRGAVTFGNFDGVHRGHRDLIAAARLRADRVGGPAVAVTFDPPPFRVLRPDAPPRPPLTTQAEKARLLLAAGADHVVTLKTDAGLLALSPWDFFERVIQVNFHALAVVEGYNFRFGKDRGGDTGTLRLFCERSNVAFEEVPPRVVGGEPVSSSRVRAAIEAGDVAATAELLDRPYAIAGAVVTGAKRGRTIGFPTANLDGVETLLPKEGVYAARAVVNETCHAAAANVGPNPTFGEDARKIEVHLLDFTGDLYGKPLTVEFVARLRDTRPFPGSGELVEQLRQDVRAARLALAGPK
jgi:riboflavin kinase/FMN adenylyltransferase